MLALSKVNLLLNLHLDELLGRLERRVEVFMLGKDLLLKRLILYLYALDEDAREFTHVNQLGLLSGDLLLHFVVGSLEIVHALFLACHLSLEVFELLSLGLVLL